MGKERLEEVEERVLVDKVYYKYLDGTKGHWGKVYTLSEEDYNYLKEQSERVQELERANKQLKGNLSVYQGYYKGTLKHNKELIEQNKRYRELLEELKQDVGNTRYSEFRKSEFRKMLFYKISEELERESE